MSLKQRETTPPRRRAGDVSAVPDWIVSGSWVLTGFLLGGALAKLWLSRAEAPMALDALRSPFQVQVGGQPESSYWEGWQQIEHIFAFGDSYTSSHFDVTKDPQPSKEFPFGNRVGKPEDNQNDTHHWIHYLRNDYAASEPIVYDLAKGGATIDAHAYEAPSPGYASADHENCFNGQIEAFRRFNETRPEFRTYWRQPGNVRWEERRALFMLWFGINDVARAINRREPLRLEPLLAAYMAGLERLYVAGAKNFLLLNVPPVYRMYRGDAAAQLQQTSASPRADTIALNALIARMRDRFLRRHPDVTVFLFDAYSLFERALADPAAFEQTKKIRKTDDTCDEYAGGADPPSYFHKACSYPIEQYFWLDDVHVTPTVHELVAASVAGNCFGPQGPQFFCS